MATDFEQLLILKSEIEQLAFFDEKNADAYLRHARMFARRLFPNSNDYGRDLEKIQFHSSVGWGGMTKEDHRPAFEEGKAQLLNTVNTMSKELELFGYQGIQRKASKPNPFAGSSIFVVHGHDEELKQVVARFLERLGLEAIILHEQPNRGKTIIEKFFDHSENVSFAIVLLSPDDIGYRESEGHKNAKYRARQNVILELGFFLGRLGRSHVAALFKEHENFEIPSDYSGILFIPYDQNGSWKNKIVKEMKAAGLQVDANLIL